MESGKKAPKGEKGRGRPAGDGPAGDTKALSSAEPPRAAPAADAVEGHDERSETDPSNAACLARLEASLDQVKGSLDPLSAKLRNLGRDIKAVTTSVGESRFRELLNRLVQFADLRDGLVEKGPDPSPAAGAAAHDTHTVLRTQMRQILRLSGVKETTPEKGATFDPSRHRATARVSTRSKKRDRTICEVQRTGFESGGQTLRYPEVTVYALEPASGSPAAKETEGEHSSSQHHA
jgi:molecular chaperone GrpE (heat shock protein)